MAGIDRLGLGDIPVAVIDCETTGLNPKADRIVKVSVVRIDPGAKPRLAFDTLVNPEGRVRATEIHDIADEDVADAPTFEEIAGDLSRATAGCVVSAYNAYFDMKFLAQEFDRARTGFDVPYFCLMYMRPMLGLGPRCSLGDACRGHGIEHVDTHVASSDALASAKLWSFCLDLLGSRRIKTFGALAALKYYKFCESFAASPLATASFDAHPACDRLTSRSKAWMTTDAFPATAPAPRKVSPAGVYWESLKAIIYDLQVTEEEVCYVAQKRQELGLTVDEVRALHAKAFAAVIGQFIEDRLLDDREAQKLFRLADCLRRLGWCPGD